MGSMLGSQRAIAGNSCLVLSKASLGKALGMVLEALVQDNRFLRCRQVPLERLPLLSSGAERLLLKLQAVTAVRGHRILSPQEAVAWIRRGTNGENAGKRSEKNQQVKDAVRNQIRKSLNNLESPFWKPKVEKAHRTPPPPPVSFSSDASRSEARWPLARDATCFSNLRFWPLADGIIATDAQTWPHENFEPVSRGAWASEQGQGFVLAFSSHVDVCVCVCVVCVCVSQVCLFFGGKNPQNGGPREKRRSFTPRVFFGPKFQQNSLDVLV